MFQYGSLKTVTVLGPILAVYMLQFAPNFRFVQAVWETPTMLDKEESCW